MARTRLVVTKYYLAMRHYSEMELQKSKTVLLQNVLMNPSNWQKISDILHESSLVPSRDGSVVPVSRYREHFTEIPWWVLQPPLRLLAHIMEGRVKILETLKIWRNYKLFSPIFMNLQTLYSTVDYIEQNCHV